MLHFKPMTLADKEEISAFFKVWNFESAEFVFSNLYIWKSDFKPHYCIEDDFLFICMNPLDGTPFVTVPIPRRKDMDFCSALTKLEKYLKSSDMQFRFGSVTEEMRELIEGCCVGRFEFIEQRDSEDYVYDAQTLISLEGKKYHSKRNHINKFVSMYQFEYGRITKADKQECMELYETWRERRGEIQEDRMHERGSLELALANLEELDLVGGAIRVNGKIQAFSLGTQLNHEMAVIHVEKANDNFAGIYAVINQQFAAHEWGDMKYINREEDMGLSGLRRAKMSYYPVRLVRKYEARLIEL